MLFSNLPSRGSFTPNQSQRRSFYNINPAPTYTTAYIPSTSMLSSSTSPYASSYTSPNTASPYYYGSYPTTAPSTTIDYTTLTLRQRICHYTSNYRIQCHHKFDMLKEQCMDVACERICTFHNKLKKPLLGLIALGVIVTLHRGRLATRATGLKIMNGIGAANDSSIQNDGVGGSNIVGGWSDGGTSLTSSFGSSRDLIGGIRSGSGGDFGTTIGEAGAVNGYVRNPSSTSSLGGQAGFGTGTTGGFGSSLTAGGVGLGKNEGVGSLSSGALTSPGGGSYGQPSSSVASIGAGSSTTDHFGNSNAISGGSLQNYNAQTDSSTKKSGRSFSTTELCSVHCGQGGSEVQISKFENDKAFRDFGGITSFSGSIATASPYNSMDILNEIVNQNGKGRVLVVDGGGSEQVAIFSNALARLAAKTEWAGVIINGCVTERGLIVYAQLGVKALCFHPNLPEKGDNGQRSTQGDTVTFAGIQFKPGQYVYVDADGILTAPEAFASDASLTSKVAGDYKGPQDQNVVMGGGTSGVAATLNGNTVGIFGGGLKSPASDALGGDGGSSNFGTLNGRTGLTSGFGSNSGGLGVSSEFSSTNGGSGLSSGFGSPGGVLGAPSGFGSKDVVTGTGAGFGSSNGEFDSASGFGSTNSLTSGFGISDGIVGYASDKIGSNGMMTGALTSLNGGSSFGSPGNPKSSGGTGATLGTMDRTVISESYGPTGFIGAEGYAIPASEIRGRIQKLKFKIRNLARSLVPSKNHMIMFVVVCCALLGTVYKFRRSRRASNQTMYGDLYSDSSYGVKSGYSSGSYLPGGHSYGQNYYGRYAY